MSIFFVQINPANGEYEERTENDCSYFVDFVKELFEDLTTATDYHYDAKDDQGCGLDTIKIIENSEGGYLSIYHFIVGGTFQVRLANSTDLFHWTFIRTIEQYASQPTIAQAPNDAYIVVFEKEDTSSHLKLHYYSNLFTLTDPNSPPNFTIDIPRNSSHPHEGTPNVYNVTIKDSVMNACIGFHFDNGTVDNIAVGWLTIPLDNPENWTWNATEQTEYNEKLRKDWNVKGNIGDRDYGQIFGRNFTLQEANLLPREEESINRTRYWASWRIFLYDHLTNNFTMLNIKTHKGSISFGNPTFTFLKSPNEKDCIVVTYFLFSEGAKEGEAGELIFCKEFETKRFSLEYNGESYFTDVTSNSTISSFNFNESERSINFNVSGPDGSKGYCIVKLPNNLTQDLWQGNYTVRLDGELCQCENWTDVESTYIYINYIHPEHEITIIPELSMLSLIIFLLTTFLVVVVRKIPSSVKR